MLYVDNSSFQQFLIAPYESAKPAVRKIKHCVAFSVSHVLQISMVA